MPIQKIEFEYDIPDGYRFVRYGDLTKGCQYINVYGSISTSESDQMSKRLIVEKIVYCEEPAETSKRHKHADLIHVWAEGAIIQFTSDPTGRLWIDCPGNNPAWSLKLSYRVKPAKKVIKFRNWLTKSGRISAWNLIGGDSVEDYNEFKCWIGDWQSVEVEEQ